MASVISGYLSKLDVALLLEIIHKSVQCSSREELGELQKKIKGLFHHEYTITSCIKRRSSLGKISDYEILFTDYPDDFMQKYSEQGWIHIDPIIGKHMTAHGPKYWADIFMEYPPPPEMAAVAGAAGMYEGYVHGLDMYAGNGKSTLAVCGKKVERSERTEMILDLLVPYLHETIAGLLDLQRRRELSRLTERETEVLSWLANGKSTWDISMILGVSERTIKYHVQNTIEKLNAMNRPHAVAIAFKAGIIDVEL